MVVGAQFREQILVSFSKECGGVGGRLVSTV